MKKFSSILNRGTSFTGGSNANGDSPEAEIARSIRLFCESGGPNNAGEEVLHLPSIVDSAESSPSAAKEAVTVIRKFLSKDNSQRAYVQYNAMMLTRILTDHPGKTFTQNIDSKFVSTLKELIKEGRDMSVQQIVRETLDNFQLQKSDDETLAPLIAMWSDYKTKMAKKAGFNQSSGGMQPGTPSPIPGGLPVLYPNIGSNHHQSRRHHSHRHHDLPPPHELASRIEEARTSGKLLTQMVQSTPPQEVLGNELLKEFAERCQSASRSIQGFINADNPSPDEDTLLTLIETNDQLSMSLSKHQRAILQARKMLSPSPSAGAQGGPFAPPKSHGPATILSPTVGAPTMTDGPYPPPAGPPPGLAMPRRQEDLENPFDDSNQAAPTTNSTRTQPGVSSLSPGEAAHGVHAEDESEEEDDQAARRYRF